MIFPQAMCRGLARGLAGLLLLAFAAQVAHARGETSVWSVKGERNTVYLAGSVHALPKDDAAFPEQLERAYQAVNVIVLEVDLDDMNPLDAIKFITTNGTLPAVSGLDWICVSPKAGTDVVQRQGDELKLVWPQEGIDPAELERWRFDHFLVQPMDCEKREEALQAAIRLAMDRPKWRLSLQAHKVVGLP